MPVLGWEANENLRALFTRLAADEAAHREAFQMLLTSVGRSRREPKDQLDEECLRAIAFASFFSEESGALAGITKLTSEEQVLGPRYLFQRRLGSPLAHFRSARQASPPHWPEAGLSQASLV